MFCIVWMFCLYVGENVRIWFLYVYCVYWNSLLRLFIGQQQLRFLVNSIIFSWPVFNKVYTNFFKEMCQKIIFLEWSNKVRKAKCLCDLRYMIEYQFASSVNIAPSFSCNRHTYHCCPKRIIFFCHKLQKISRTILSQV